MRVSENDKDVICHEWGHYLVAYLLGKENHVERLEFHTTNNETIIWGHNVYKPIVMKESQNGFIPDNLTDKENLLILYGGCVACNVTDMNGKRIAGTDKEKVWNLTKTSQQRSEAESRVIEMLTPYKDTLRKLTEMTYKFCKNCEDDLVIISWYEIQLFLKEVNLKCFEV